MRVSQPDVRRITRYVSLSNFEYTNWHICHLSLKQGAASTPRVFQAAASW